MKIFLFYILTFIAGVIFEHAGRIQIEKNAIVSCWQTLNTPAFENSLDGKRSIKLSLYCVSYQLKLVKAQ